MCFVLASFSGWLPAVSEEAREDFTGIALMPLRIVLRLSRFPRASLNPGREWARDQRAVLLCMSKTQIH